MKNKIWVTAVVTILIASFIPIIIEIVQTTAFAIIEVDDDGGKDYQTIQEAIDAAQPGDTVFVYAGVYYEDVYIDKTINLTGISRDNTTINATGIGIFVENADYVNITGFTIENGSSAGIRMMPSNNSIIVNNKVKNNEYGIQITDSNNTVVNGNIASDNNNYDGILLLRSTNITVNNNICLNNSRGGIWLQDNSNYNIIKNNNCSNNNYGIYLSIQNNNNLISNNIALFNDGPSIDSSGIYIASSDNNYLYNNTLLSNKYGLIITSTSSVFNYVINSTIKNSNDQDVVIGPKSQVFFLNTTFDKDNVLFVDTISILNVKWYLHINVFDYLGNPIPNAKVKIENNKNGSYNETFTTDAEGHIRWLSLTEYIEQDNNDDSVGEKTFFTPHRIIAWNDTLVGYAYPEPNINKSKTVIIVLFNGTQIMLKPGWNLVSLPRVQSDTSLQVVLQSIESHYDAVQWYNVTDNSDPWKHHHILKSSNLNDLSKLNLTMGFWLHVIDPTGTTLIVIGNELTSNQYISLFPGWNLIGYPSKSNKTRDIGLGTLNYGSDVDSIWTYNSTLQKWIELNDSADYFEIGQGYWIHSRVTKVWNVPL